jgi:hypothetical protein
MEEKYKFWTSDPYVLINNKKYLEFLPKLNMTRAEQLNAITRFCIYTLILALILNKNEMWIQFPIIVIIGVVVLYYLFKNDKLSKINMSEKDIEEAEYNENNDFEPDKVIIESGYYDPNNNLNIGKYTKATDKKKKVTFKLDDYTKYEKARCKMPTKHNPFMNSLLNNITTDEDPPVACNSDDDNINEKITDCFNEKLFRDLSDTFDRENSQRQFYTVPRTNPNDQTEFAKWAYAGNRNCKTEQGDCLRYEDVRFKR